MPRFKVGDIVIGKGYSNYNYTTEDAVMRITKVHADGIYIRVLILEHTTYPSQVGQVYDVAKAFFRLRYPSFLQTLEDELDEII